MSPWARIAWGLLALSAAFSLLVESGLLARPVPPDLERLPPTLGPLELGQPIPIEVAALGDLPPERWTFRGIRDAAGNEGKVFVAYYRRAQRWSGRPHDVDLCFESLGWEERSAERLSASPFPWSRVFERQGERVRVVHWLEHPGVESDPLAPATIAARLATPRGLRPDVASIYLEFPEASSPAQAELHSAAAALSEALEGLWSAVD